MPLVPAAFGLSTMQTVPTKPSTHLRDILHKLTSSSEFSVQCLEAQPKASRLHLKGGTKTTLQLSPLTGSPLALLGSNAS